MKQPHTEKLAISPFTMAQEFWGKWITSISFRSEVTDPMTILTHEVAQAHGVNTTYAREAVEDAFDATLDYEIAKQKENK